MKNNSGAVINRKETTNFPPSLNTRSSPHSGDEPGPPKFKLSKGNTLVQKEKDKIKFIIQMRKSFGSFDPDFFIVLLNQIGNINADAQTDQVRAANFSSSFMHGLKPKDQTEAILFAQMAGTHNLIMEFMRKAIYPDQYLDAAEKYTHRACKLMNLFLRQIEALDKYRGKSTQQKVIVEHVNIGEGGKAIVGNIENTISGGRDGDKK